MAAGWEGSIAERRRGVLVYLGLWYQVENNRMTSVGLSQPFLFIYVGQNTAVTVGITTLE
jgi:hypothetical protein